MQKTISLKSGKKVRFPARMLREKDIEEMQIPYFEKGILFVKIKQKEEFPLLTNELKENMALMGYIDCSRTHFSGEILLNVVKKQLDNDFDFIILPYFKDENNLDVRNKIRLADKLMSSTNKQIVLEVSYKLDMETTELSKNAEKFDLLSIFYGVHYGHFNQLNKIVKRVVEFRNQTNKDVFCNAVPLMFSGENQKDVYFMPCFSIISDGWVKNWKQGGGNKNTIKLIDPKDYKNKDYTGWLSSGRRNDELVTLTGRNVYELFNTVDNNTRNEFKKLLCDEAITEINALNPEKLEKFMFEKLNRKYFGLMLLAYREKMIINLFRKAKSFLPFNKKELSALEEKIREQIFPSKVAKEISYLVKCVENDNISKVPLLIQQIDSFRSVNS